MPTPLAFSVDPALCTRCGACVADCPARILHLPETGPAQMQPDTEDQCYRCQHCLAICPSAALSILGVNPAACLPLAPNLPTPLQLETLVRGRRSTRRYKEEDLPREQILSLLQAASAAPTGRNKRALLWTVVGERTRLAVLRERLLERIDEAARAGALPAGLEQFARFPELWRNEGVDILFRGAPHFLVASTTPEAATPQVDGTIALAYFELLANSRGIGTVWDGLAYWAMTLIAPEAPQWLGIPADHKVGYCMAFGLPQRKFARTVQHPSHAVRWFGE